MEAFYEMKAVYREVAQSLSQSYDVVKSLHCHFKCGRVETVPIPGRTQSAIDDATIQHVEIPF